MSVPDTFVSYAQHGEDVILWRALGDRGSCFYVDVGAFDPTYDSVTRALYERGWRGINIEPQPDRLSAFEEARPEDINLSLAVGDVDGTATLRIPATAGWATTLESADPHENTDAIRTLEVPMRRLDTLLPELGITHVDVLKVDVEGAEPAVIRGLLGGPTRPDVCVVEGVAPGVGRAAGDEAVSLLVEAGYVHCLFDGLNHYLTIDAASQPLLSIPANPLDDYTRVSLVNLDRERQQLVRTIETLGAENLRLREAHTASLPQKARSSRARTGGSQSAAGELSVRPVVGVGPRVPLDSDEFEVARGVHDPRALDPETRAERRRRTFRWLLASESAPLTQTATPDLLTLAVSDLPSIEAVSLLYLTVLGREPDPGGLAGWADRVDSGESLLAVARGLAESAEATARPAEDRARVLNDLQVWESVTVLRELGVSLAQPGHLYSPGRIRDEIFVEALFEVALGRRPHPEEISYETDMLIAGGGREWLMRAYANRPEVRARFLGTHAVGLRGRLRRRLDGFRYLDFFRDLVVAAEARQIDHLLARLSAVDPARLARAQASTAPAEEN